MSVTWGEWHFAWVRGPSRELLQGMLYGSEPYPELTTSRSLINQLRDCDLVSSSITRQYYDQSPTSLGSRLTLVSLRRLPSFIRLLIKFVDGKICLVERRLEQNLAVQTPPQRANELFSSCVS